MAGGRSELCYFSSVRSHSVRWLWYPYIPFGKISLIEGDPGEGKTAVILDIISRLTTGSVMPDGSVPDVAANVLYEFSEDGIADTICPRLEKYGADLSRVAYLQSGDVWMSSNKVWNAVRKLQAKAVIFDPFQAFLRGPEDDTRSSSIRKIMTEVARQADQNGCAVILLGHMNKAEGSRQLYRGLGSIEIPAAARSVLLIERLQEGSPIRCFRQIKNSLATEGESLNFEVNPEGKIIWIGPSGEENDDVIRQAQSNRTAPKHDLIVGKMMEWLFDEDLTCIEIYRRAKELGISVRTVDRVKAELKIKSVHKAEGWYWHLDSEAKNACENKQENGSDNFQESNPGTIQPQD